MPTDLVNRWADALDRRDPDAMTDLLADDVVLHSPLTNAFVFRGRESVGAVFASASELLDDVRVHTRLSDGRTAVVVFAGRCGGEPFEEMHLLRLDDTGAVADVTLMGRPVSALMYVMGRIPALLARRGVMPPAAGPAAWGIRPIGALLRGIDRSLVPRLPPR